MKINNTYYIRSRHERGESFVYELYAYENGIEYVHERRTDLIEMLSLAINYYGFELKLE